MTTLKRSVYDNGLYAVFIVRMPDMAFDTYGVVNKDTEVIEQIQPNLYNAKYIADQFKKWLVEGPSDSDEVESILAQLPSTGKIN